MEHDLTKLLRE